MDRLKEQLKMMKKNSDINPSKDWVFKNREVLSSYMRQTSVVTEHKNWLNNFYNVSLLFVPRQVAVMARSLILLIIAGGVGVVGWIASVSAAYGSLPGEVLYNVKMANETGELLAASMLGSGHKVKTLMKHASNRVEELKNTKSPEQATQVIQSLKKTVTSASESLAKVQGENNGDNSIAVEMARVVDEKTANILDTLKTETSKDSVSTTLNSELNKEVLETKEVVESVAVKAVEVLIEKKITDEKGVDVNIDEVKEKVEKRLESIVSDLGISTSSSASSSVIIEKIEKTSEKNNLITTNTNSTTSASSTGLSILGKSVSSSENNNGDKSKTDVSKDVPKNSEQINEEATKIVTEAKTLIQSNDLNNILGAIKKVQELGEVKKEAQNISDAAKLEIVPISNPMNTVTGTSISASSSVSSSLKVETISEIKPVEIKPISGSLLNTVNKVENKR